MSYQFFQALEAGQCTGDDSGRQSIFIEDEGRSLLYSFVKNHSYGEYIFDWDWANFNHNHNTPYYPKLTSTVPFTSATSPHFLGERSKRVMEEYEELYRINSFSSSHF